MVSLIPRLGNRCMVTQNKTQAHVIVPVVPGGAAGRKEVGILILPHKKDT